MDESIFESEGVSASAPEENEAPSTPAVADNADDAFGGYAESGEAPRAEGNTDATPTDAYANEAANEGAIDYEEIMREDLAALKATFPELAELNAVSELSGAFRYAALRDMGLSAVEAYMASSAPRSRRDNRSHLSSAVARGAAAPANAMSHEELCTARKLFPGMSDAEIYSLYKRVTS